MAEEPKPYFRVSGVYLECNGKFLILKRASGNRQGNKWGLPAGKIEIGESPQYAAVRELYEETGYKIKPEELEFVGKFELDFPDSRITYFRYKAKTDKMFEVKLNSREHTGYKWITREEFDKIGKENVTHGLGKLMDE